MDEFEFNPSRLHECTGCGEIIRDIVLRMTSMNVLCLACTVEVSLRSLQVGLS